MMMKVNRSLESPDLYLSRVQFASMLIGAAVGQLLVEKGILSLPELSGRVRQLSDAVPDRGLAPAAELAIGLMARWGKEKPSPAQECGRDEHGNSANDR